MSKNCNHCWIWSKKHYNDWMTEEGDIFDGWYLAMRCGHCNKPGKIIAEWDDDLHSKIPEGSKRGYENVHRSRGCPAAAKKREMVEYEYDF